MGPWYASVQDVKEALDSKESARNDRQVEAALASASRDVESLLHRFFYPLVATRYFDWPTRWQPVSWRLWLGEAEVVSVSNIVSGSVTLTSDDYFLEPVNIGPPYDRIEINLGSFTGFSVNRTPQRSIAVTGVFGYDLNVDPAGTTAEALDATETGVDVSDSSTLGVGDLITVDSERMLITGRSMLDSGQNIGGNLDVLDNAVNVPVSSGAGYNIGETILVDSERMLIVDIAGNNLTVIRGWDGTVLASHTSGADIYVPRTLTVQRGSLGTTAATHSTSAPISKHIYPGPVHELCVAEALNNLLQRSGGYARTAGSGDSAVTYNGRGLDDLRKRALRSCGRGSRVLAV